MTRTSCVAVPAPRPSFTNIFLKGVRRLALSSLNSAAHNKPHLLRDQLSTLLPELYSQTVVDESLVRIVEMGPFKHKEIGKSVV